MSKVELLSDWLNSSRSECLLHRQTVVRKAVMHNVEVLSLRTLPTAVTTLRLFFAEKVLSCKTKKLKQKCKRITDCTNKILLKKCKISFWSKRFERSWRSRRSRRSGGMVDPGGFGDSVVLKGLFKIINYHDSEKVGQITKT